MIEFKPVTSAHNGYDKRLYQLNELEPTSLLT